MEFQPEKESWDSYAERLEHFFTATGMIDSDKKVFTLIHQNGPTLYTLLKDLTFPQNPTQMSYAAIMDILKRHYVGAKNVFCERKTFYAARMTPYETASEWHRRLRSLVIDCNFGGFLEEILVDKFVTGFNGTVLHRLYEQDVNLTLQQALEIAQRHENDSINNTKRDKSQSRQNAKQPTEVEQENRQKKPQEPKSIVTCLNCGKKGHSIDVCRYKPRSNKGIPAEHVQHKQIGEHQKPSRNPVTCFKCGKNGHYANVCRSTWIANNNGGYVIVPPESHQPHFLQQVQGSVQAVKAIVVTCDRCGRKGHFANECRSAAPRREGKDENCIIS